MRVKTHIQGVTIGELLVAASIAIFVIGGVFTLWFMAQDTWTNERTKSEILQELQVTMERIKREMKVSDGGRMFFHASGGIYDAISLPIALDDGRSDTGYSSSKNGDGFIETDSSTRDPITGVERIWWDKTIIYHLYPPSTPTELRRTEFYPRDNTLTAAQRQDQLDKVVSLGTGNNSTIPNYANWQSTRTIFKANSLSFEVTPKLREFDGYSDTTERTENLIDFGSTILNGGYHTIKFIVTDKHTGYAFGIDSLKLTPCGGVTEVEEYIGLIHPNNSPGIAASSGDSLTAVNMYESEYGLWSADYYLNYAADAKNDYITLNIYYDMWYETTFLDGVADNTTVEFSNTDGRGGTSGNEEWLLRLEGKGTTWEAATQTQDSNPASEAASDVTYRNLIMGNYTSLNGRMLSVKFHAGSNNSLTIKSAYIIQKDDSGSGLEDDGSGDMPSILITFTDCNVDPRNTGQTGGTPTQTGYGVTIPAGCHAWSNWIILHGDDGIDFNFDKMKDYFISFYVPVSSSSILHWQDQASSPKTQSYKRTDERLDDEGEGTGEAKHDDVAVWGGAGTVSTSIYGVEKIDVTYVNSGTWSSQVFDTAVDDPAYGTMKWNAIINNPDATLQLRVRSSDSETALEGDGDWSTITGSTYSITSGTGSVSLSGIGSGRYVQFRAELTAIASGTTDTHLTYDEAGETPPYAGDEDYDLSCVLKNVSIYWPGNTTMVDVGGYFTKRPDYGIFTVEIDGQQLTKGFVIDLSITEKLTTGENVSRSISAEVEPRNTNK